LAVLHYVISPNGRKLYELIVTSDIASVKAWRISSFFLAVKKKEAKKNSRLRPLLWKGVSEVGAVLPELANAEFCGEVWAVLLDGGRHTRHRHSKV
jgi:hypothetical protein